MERTSKTNEWFDRTEERLKRAKDLAVVLPQFPFDYGENPDFLAMAKEMVIEDETEKEEFEKRDKSSLIAEVKELRSRVEQLKNWHLASFRKANKYAKENTKLKAILEEKGIELPTEEKE